MLTTNALASDPENDRARRMLPTNGRVERAAKLVKQPLPDVAAFAAVLRDQKAIDDSARPVGHRGLIDDGQATQTVILDPASLELWVADPRAGNRMRAFDLRHGCAAGRSPYSARRHSRRPTADPDRIPTLARARAGCAKPAPRAPAIAICGRSLRTGTRLRTATARDDRAR
ncbi:MAG: hypothetical protein WKG01_38060 [Kofleriaceae bacterium]